VRGIAPPKAEKRCPTVQNSLRVRSPPRVRRIPRGEGSNKEDEKSKSILQSKSEDYLEGFFQKTFSPEKKQFHGLQEEESQ
jgi:hypothetical protein